MRQSQLKIVERLGSGSFGETHLCYYLGNKTSALVVVKSLDTNATYEKRSAFSGSSSSLYNLYIMKASTPFYEWSFLNFQLPSYGLYIHLNSFHPELKCCCRAIFLFDNIICILGFKFSIKIFISKFRSIEVFVNAYNKTFVIDDSSRRKRGYFHWLRTGMLPKLLESTWRTIPGTLSGSSPSRGIWLNFSKITWRSPRQPRSLTFHLSGKSAQCRSDLL